MRKSIIFFSILALVAVIATGASAQNRRRSRIGGPRIDVVGGITRQNAQWADTFGREYTTGYGFGGYNNGLGGVIDRVGGVIFGNRANRDDIQTDCCGHPEDPPAPIIPPVTNPAPEPWNPPARHGGLSKGKKIAIGVTAVSIGGIVAYKLTHRHHDDDKDKGSQSNTRQGTRYRGQERRKATPQDNLMCIANRDALSIAVYYGGNKIALVKPDVALWPIPNGIRPGELVTKVARKSQAGWSWVNEATEAVACTDPPDTDSDQ